MATKNWVIDPTHSEIQFKIKHLMITVNSGHVDPPFRDVNPPA